MPEVTVLTCVRNGMKYLPQTLDSILQQTYKDFEYIVVDDCSSDDTLKYLEKQVELDRRIRVVRRSKSGGPWVAANDGLTYATGKYTVRIDADDVAVPKRIERQIDFLKQNPKLKGCGSYAQISLADDLSPIKVSYPILGESALKWQLVFSCILIHSTACIETEALREVYTTSPLASEYLRQSLQQKFIADVEDYRMWTRLSRRNAIGFVPEILVKYRRHANSVSQVRQTEQFEFAKDVIREHISELTQTVVDQNSIDGYAHIGLLRQYSLKNGLRLIAQWNRWWQSDQHLDLAQYEALKRFSKRQSLRFAWANKRSYPYTFMSHFPQLVVSWFR